MGNWSSALNKLEASAGSVMNAAALRAACYRGLGVDEMASGHTVEALKYFEKAGDTASLVSTALSGDYSQIINANIELNELDNESLMRLGLLLSGAGEGQRAAEILLRAD